MCQNSGTKSTYSYVGDIYLAIDDFVAHSIEKLDKGNCMP